MQAYRSRRPAFTLIELLVVIAIITILAALTAIFFPRFQDQELVNRGADQLQGWLLAAKMQAKRDRLPTGFRLILDPSGNVTSLSYIQQPDNFALGTYIGADTDPNPATIPNPPFPTFGFPRAKFSLPAGVTFFTPIMSRVLPTRSSSSRATISKSTGAAYCTGSPGSRSPRPILSPSSPRILWARPLMRPSSWSRRRHYRCPIRPLPRTPHRPPPSTTASSRHRGRSPASKN